LIGFGWSGEVAEGVDVDLSGEWVSFEDDDDDR